MDSLDHMLTDPLELGPCGDGNGARIMEDCLLGTTRVSLPEDLLEDVSSALCLQSLDEQRVLTSIVGITEEQNFFATNFIYFLNFCTVWFSSV